MEGGRWNRIVKNLQTTADADETGMPVHARIGFFAFPDIYVDSRGWMFMPAAVTARIDPEWIAKAYGYNSTDQLASRLAERKPLRQQVLDVMNRTSNRAVRSAESALIEANELYSRFHFVTSSLPFRIRDDWDTIQDEIRARDGVPHPTGDFVLAVRPRSRQQIQNLVAQIWILFCRDLMRSSPNEGTSGPAYTLLDERQRDRIADDRILRTTNLSRIFRCVQAKYASTEDWRKIFDFLFPLPSNNVPSQGYKTLGSLALYRQSIANVDLRLVSLIREGLWTLTERVSWLPFATADRLWNTSYAASWRYFGLKPHRPAPRIAVRMYEDVESITVSESDEAGAVDPVVQRTAPAAPRYTKRKSSEHDIGRVQRKWKAAQASRLELVGH